MKMGCSVDGCSGQKHAHGFCSMHATRYIRYGDPLGGGAAKPRGSAIERVWNHVDRTDDCWLWTGGTWDFGYGKFNPSKGEVVRAHRWLWELARGPTPKGLELDHLCRPPACVRPDHLEPVTHQENLRRGSGWAGTNARKTHCPKGHEYTEANTYRQASRGNGRVCRTCMSERNDA